MWLKLTLTAAVVPGAPPGNVAGEPVSPTAIKVSWDPPPANRSNGNIIYYKLQFVEADRSDSEASVIKLNATSFELDELKRWTTYRIWVLAGTSVGDGPISFPITVRTHEDGTLIVFNTRINKLLSTIFYYSCRNTNLSGIETCSPSIRVDPLGSNLYRFIKFKLITNKIYCCQIYQLTRQGS